MLDYKKISNLDVLFESIISMNGTPMDVVKYRKLNENQKKDITTGYGEVIINLIKDKTSQYSSGKKSYEDEIIERTRGDVNKLAYLPLIRESVMILKNIVTNNTQASSKSQYVNIIEYTINGLSSNADNFERSFKNNDEVGMSFYRETVKTLIYYTVYLMSSFLVVEKTNSQKYELIYNSEFDENVGSFSFMYSILERVTTLAGSGKLNSFFLATSKHENFMEVVTSGAILTFAVLSVLLLLREMVYFYFWSRVKLSDYLRYLSTLLEINKNTSKLDKNVVSNQQKYISTLKSLADKIDIDVKMSVKSTERDIKNEKKLNTIKSEKDVSQAVPAGNYF